MCIQLSTMPTQTHSVCASRVNDNTDIDMHLPCGMTRLQLVLHDVW